MTKLMESMCCIPQGDRTIRVWRQEAESFCFNPESNEDLVAKASELRNESTNTLAQALSDMPRVNAVEVLDQQRQGIVVYNNWP